MIRATTTVAAFAVLAFAASGCKKADTTSAANTEAASANTTNATVADTAVAKGSDAVSVAQDAVAGPVGMLSAATAGSLSAAAFVDNAAQSDMYETQASQIALERSKSPKIKAFARMMIKAHAGTTAELKSIVNGGKAGDAKLPEALDNRRQGLIDNLKSASADDFDARYVDQQTAAHHEAETLMGGYGGAGQNADLKAFAAETKPKVTAHYNMVKALDHANADHDNKMGDGGSKS